jgi:hypothetical protein
MLLMKSPYRRVLLNDVYILRSNFYFPIISASSKVLCVSFFSSIVLWSFEHWLLFQFLNPKHGSRDRVVGIVTGYRLDNRKVGVLVPVGSRIYSSPRRPDRLCGPPSLLSNGHPGLFPRG